MTPLDPFEKERLLEEFRASIESLSLPEEGSENEKERITDLYDLFVELSLLRNEVRLSSRQFKSALDDLRKTNESLGKENERLLREGERFRVQGEELKSQTERRFLLELLDLRDRLDSGVKAHRSYRPSFLARLFSSEARFLGSLGEGLSMTLARTDEMLARYRVRPVESVGRPFAPRTMRAVGVAHSDDVPDGTVLQEIRKGYLCDGDVLRLGEVVVNKN